MVQNIVLETEQGAVIAANDAKEPLILRVVSGMNRSLQQDCNACEWVAEGGSKGSRGSKGERERGQGGVTCQL